MLFGDDLVKHRHVALVFLLGLLVAPFRALTSPVRTEQAAYTPDGTTYCIHYTTYHPAYIQGEQGIGKLADTFAHGVEAIYHTLHVLINIDTEALQCGDDGTGSLTVG